MGKLLKKLLPTAAHSFVSSFATSTRFIDDPDCCSVQSDGDGACSYERFLGEGSHAGNDNIVKAKKEKKKKEKKVPKGCVPVVVNGKHRLLLDVSRLAHPLLASLLQQTAQETGYTWHYSGALRLSCDPASFPHLLRLATTPSSHASCRTIGTAPSASCRTIFG